MTAALPPLNLNLTSGSPPGFLQAVWYLGQSAVAYRRGHLVDLRRRLAFAVYSSSFSVTEPDARFLVLMAALEALIEPKQRPSEVVDHVDALIASTKASNLPDAEKASLVRSLNWLRVQSIGQAGRELASTLGEKVYDGRKPAAFFKRCYSTRSDLIHGNIPLPERQDVDRMAAILQRFVGDLLSGALATDLPPFEPEGPGRQAWEDAIAGLG
ncbi:hypothetical protein [Luteimicrobium sp. DT211]|uniref:hypothetical protein n=1 Tax=Luteimicrobium sp. DT211 TaxID=3393412 RepID=UPI003CE8E7A2